MVENRVTNMEAEADFVLLDRCVEGNVSVIHDQSIDFSPGYFLLTDSFYTTIVMVTTLQNQVIEYDFVKLNYLTMVGSIFQFFGIYGYWTVQHKYNLRNKTMWCWVVFCIVLLDLWGLMGNWTQKIGFHQAWEFWVFQIWWGLISAYYSYSQIMVSSFIRTPSYNYTSYQSHYPNKANASPFTDDRSPR